MSKLIESAFFLCALTVALLTLIAIFEQLGMLKDIDGAEAAADEYCMMVYINKKDPDKGWPDYNNTYEKFCDGPNWRGN